MNSDFSFWLDAHFSDKIGRFIEEEFLYPCKHVRLMGARSISDKEIFQKLRQPGNVLITKDSDFLELITQYKSRPQIVWLTFGNSRNEKVTKIFKKSFPIILEKLREKEELIEISDLL